MRYINFYISLQTLFSSFNTYKCSEGAQSYRVEIMSKPVNIVRSNADSKGSK